MAKENQKMGARYEKNKALKYIWNVFDIDIGIGRML